MIQAFLFAGALIWGAAMQMGYERLLAEPELSDQTIGFITLLFYLIAALSFLAALAGGEGPLLGYIIGMLFTGAYRRQRRRKG